MTRKERQALLVVLSEMDSVIDNQHELLRAFGAIGAITAEFDIDTVEGRRLAQQNARRLAEETSGEIFPEEIEHYLEIVGASVVLADYLREAE